MTDNREQLSNLLTTALRTLDDNQISHLAYSLLERIPADKWPAGLVKKEEIAKALDFVLQLSADEKMDMIDGQFYWREDQDGDQPLESEDIIKLLDQQQPLPAPPSQLKK